MLARLHGLDPGPVERAQVLDIGASEGGNIIPLAMRFPEARFTGIDLAATPIERGSAVIADLGLPNIRLLQKDLLDLDSSFGRFDYIVAHGLYGWTPPEVGDKVLALARELLTPHGVAFISYNTHPGGHLRKLVRDAMLFQAARFESPREQVAAARAMLDLMAAGCPEPDLIEQSVAFQAGLARERSDSSLYHDYMAPVFEPAYFRDFAAHAARHGLAYMADANVADSYNMKLSPEALAAVGAAGPQGRIAQEQMLDFLRVRRFRRSLVCHQERRPAARWDPARARGLYASSSVEEDRDSEFSGMEGFALHLEGGAAKLVRGLMQVWPGSRPLDPEEVDLALELYRRGMISLSTLPCPAARAGERPLASRLVRYQAERGDAAVATLRHRPLAVEDEAGRKLLSLLDGSRSRDELASAMGCPREQIEQRLSFLERHAVLLG